MFGQRQPNEAKYLGLPLADIEVVDALGNKSLLSALIQGGPILLSPVYTKCPSACSVITAHLKGAVKKAGGLGEKYTVVTFSFDHEDTPEDLQVFVQRWELDNMEWKTVSADSTSTALLLQSIDYEVVKDNYGEYEHPNVVVVISTDMKISRFIHGVIPRSRDINMGVLEASKGNISLSFYDGFLLRCFKFDNEAKRYVIDWAFVTQVSVGLFVLSVLAVILIRDMFFKDIAA